jgi:hypothetical protein
MFTMGDNIDYEWCISISATENDHEINLRWEPLPFQWTYRVVNGAVHVDETSETLASVCEPCQPATFFAPRRLLYPRALPHFTKYLTAQSISNLRRACLMSVVGNGAPASGAIDDVPRDRQAAPTVMDGLSSSKVTGESLIIIFRK